MQRTKYVVSKGNCTEDKTSYEMHIIYSMKYNNLRNAYFILHTIYQNLLFPISGVNQPR